MKTLRSKRALARLLPLTGIAAILVTTACLDSTDPQPPSASVVFINASPTAADAQVDLYVNDALATPVSQSFFSGSLLNVRDVSSAVNLTVKRASDMTNLASGTFPLAIDSVYMVVYHATLEGGGNILFLHDTLQSTTAARFQLANLAMKYAAGTGAAGIARQIDVYVAPTGTVPANQLPPINTRVATGVPFGAVTPYQDIPQDTGYVTFIITRTSDGLELARRDSILTARGYVTTMILGDQTTSAASNLYGIDTESPF